MNMTTASVRASSRVQQGNPPLGEEGYAQGLQCSRQWRGFLQALKQEFVAVLPEKELTRVMRQVGRRFAQAHPLAARTTLVDLQQEMNRIWSERDWGFVQLVQSDRALEINHRFSPLVAAFGQAEAVWSTGYLQGAYQQWFEDAGAGSLRVELIAPSDALGSAHCRLVAA